MREMTNLALETRKRTAVDNWHETQAPVAGELALARKYKAAYMGALHRPTPVCHTYNCHGLTFASRRAQITSASVVRKILIEDDYDQIHPNDILPGDIAIYLAEDGDIEHSGIIVSIDAALLGRAPKVLSKWGSAHEVVHQLRDCPYNPIAIEFYRVTK